MPIIHRDTHALAESLLQGFDDDPLELAKYLASQHKGPKRSMRLQGYRDPYADHKRNDAHHRIFLPDATWQWFEATLLDAMLLGDQHYSEGWLASDLLKMASELELVRRRFRISGGDLEEPIGVIDAPQEMIRGIAVTVGIYFSILLDENLLPMGSVDHFRATGVALPQLFSQITRQLPGKPDFLVWASQ
jgi:hypothetical protein